MWRSGVKSGSCFYLLLFWDLDILSVVMNNEAECLFGGRRWFESRVVRSVWIGVSLQLFSVTITWEDLRFMFYPSFGFCSIESHKCKTKFVFLWTSCVIVFYFSTSRWRYLLNAAGFLVPADAHREVILAKITVLVSVLHCNPNAPVLHSWARWWCHRISCLPSLNENKQKNKISEEEKLFISKTTHQELVDFFKTSLKLQRKQIQIGFTPSQIQKSHFICVNYVLKIENMMAERCGMTRNKGSPLDLSQGRFTTVAWTQLKILFHVFFVRHMRDEFHPQSSDKKTRDHFFCVWNKNSKCLEKQQN